ncbi:MAG: PD-(D/E)XK nuclease family protein [Candidatus Omnitrophota bacterium]|nr:MAG: PD-(D/E)XK nuclease family protein [Candidatus Omnitrophota bacterium]
MSSSRKKFLLSPYTLNIFLDCPRCFWFHVIKGKEFRRPEPPTSSLPVGMDNIIKSYFDQYRKINSLPPEVSSTLKGKLIEQSLIKDWRFWKTGLKFTDTDGQTLCGALDECLISEGLYIPVDYKTRGFDLKEDSHSYYIFQMSCYNFLIKKNNYPVSDYAYLIFYISQAIKGEGLVKFKIEVKKINTLKPDKVYETFRKALETLELKEPPPASKDCQFCLWAQRIIESHKKQLRLF